MNAKGVTAIVVVLLFLVIFVDVIGQGVPVSAVVTSPATSAGAAIWNGRTLEVILQGLIILSGVVAILLLLKKDPLRGTPP